MNPLQDFMRMRRDLKAVRPDLDVWGFALNMPLLIGGLAFAYTVEGALILTSELLALVVASQLHRRRPLSRLMGLCHLPWLPLIPALVHWFVAHDHGTVFRAWLVYAIAVMALSVTLDAVDLYRYLTSDDKSYASRRRAA